MKTDLIPIDRDQLKLNRPNYPDNCLARNIAEDVRGKVNNIYIYIYVESEAIYIYIYMEGRQHMWKVR